MNEETGNRASEKGSGKPTSSHPDAQTAGGAGGGVRSTKLLAGLLSRLGLGHVKAGEHRVEAADVATGLAHRRTDLAMERSYMAAERTLMGWIRTSLAMISFGFTIGKLGQVLQDVEIKGLIGKVRTVSIEDIAYFLVILGTVALLGAAFQYRRRVHGLYAMGLHHQFGITFIIALVLVALGGFALCGLVLAL